MPKIIDYKKPTDVICDNPACDYTVDTDDIESFLDVPCPKCGENLLTKKDLDHFKGMLKFIDRINFWFGWLAWFGTTKDPKVVSYHHHDGKTTIIDEK